MNSLNYFLLSASLVISESVKAQTESEMKRILDLSNTEVVQPVDLNSIDIRYHVPPEVVHSLSINVPQFNGI